MTLGFMSKADRNICMAFSSLYTHKMTSDIIDLCVNLKKLNSFSVYYTVQMAIKNKCLRVV